MPRPDDRIAREGAVAAKNNVAAVTIGNMLTSMRQKVAGNALSMQKYFVSLPVVHQRQTKEDDR